jgi:hypothetical protein
MDFEEGDQKRCRQGVVPKDIVPSPRITLATEGFGFRALVWRQWSRRLE